MPTTDSEASGEERPHLNFGWESPYGHIVKLIGGLSITGGIVLELGCSYGPVAEPLAGLGLHYVGMDSDKDALDDLRGRGFTCFEVDLMDSEDLAEQVEKAIRQRGGEPVRAVLLLDVLEHLPDTDTFLTTLREIFEMIDNPLLLVSIPNVAHVDVGAKLALGRFDYTTSGLLDSTHVSFFTESRMTGELAAHGWLEVASHDFSLHRSDQSFPEFHPAVAPGSSFRNFVRHWRNESDSNATVNQFVRAFASTNALIDPAGVSEPVREHFLTVVMRTEGYRQGNLREALTCLAAQTSDDFNVKLMVHTPDDRVVERVQQLVDEFDARFAVRCLVKQVVGGQRARPLNKALELVDSHYVAFLDDDDLVTGDWVSTFAEGAKKSMGQVVRSITVDQQVHRSGNPDAMATYTIHTGLHAKHALTFDMAQHFYANQTPICSFAVPASVIECFHLRFDEGLPVIEDWEFLLRASQVSGVYDTKAVTSVYRRWVAGESSMNMVDSSVWEGVRTGILHRFDQAPLLLPKGSASRISKLYESSLRLEQDVLEAKKEADRHAEYCRAETDELKKQIEGMQRSLSWRVTLPVRVFLHYARRFAGRR